MSPPHHDHAEDQKRKGGNVEQFPHGTNLAHHRQLPLATRIPQREQEVNAHLLRAHNNLPA
jgi:hypothetical protein